MLGALADLAQTAAQVAAWGAGAVGVFFLLAGAVGLLRMPDMYSRVHAAGLMDTLGVQFILLGLAFEIGWTLALAKLGLISLVLLGTGLATTHALCKAAARHEAVHGGEAAGAPAGASGDAPLDAPESAGGRA